MTNTIQLPQDISVIETSSAKVVLDAVNVFLKHNQEKMDVLERVDLTPVSMWDTLRLSGNVATRVCRVRLALSDILPSNHTVFDCMRELSVRTMKLERKVRSFSKSLDRSVLC